MEGRAALLGVGGAREGPGEGWRWALGEVGRGRTGESHRGLYLHGHLVTDLAGADLHFKKSALAAVGKEKGVEGGTS